MLVKKYWLNIGILILVVAAGVGTILTVRADTPDQTSCNGNLITYYHDVDADSYGDPSQTVKACSQPAGYVATSSDCNDANPAIYPTAPEICDSLDNDCDSQIDEQCQTSNTYWRDVDADGYGNPADWIKSLTQPAGYVANDDDCNDANAAIHPGATEVCDGVDNDCDGQIDESVKNIFYRDADQDGFGWAASSTTACSAPVGYVINKTDCNDNNVAIHPSAAEICDNLDNDCDGKIDDGVTNTYYRDADADGYGDVSKSIQACSQPGGYVIDKTDCDDTNAAIHPGATEACDGKDNNCNGQIDEGCPLSTFYRDADGDSYGNVSQSVQTAVKPAGYVANDDDCNDANAAIHPGATEVCDGVDNDCDGQIDETGQLTFYRDADSDGYGDPAISTTACTAPTGYVANKTDCNDANVNIHPGATETPNGQDDDCDSLVDENCHCHDQPETPSCCQPADGCPAQGQIISCLSKCLNWCQKIDQPCSNPGQMIKWWKNQAKAWKKLVKNNCRITCD